MILSRASFDQRALADLRLERLSPRVPALMALLTPLLLATACDDPASERAAIPLESEDLVPASLPDAPPPSLLPGPTVNIEALISSKLVVDLRDQSVDEQLAYLDTLAGSKGDVATRMDAQLELARNQLRQRGLYLNLTSSQHAVVAANFDDEGMLSISYESQLQTILALDEATAAEDLFFGTQKPAISLRLPDQPRRVLAAAGVACFPEQSDQQGLDRSLAFELDEAGCEPAINRLGAELVEARIEALERTDEAQRFPEYHQLTDDGRLDAVVFFSRAIPRLSTGLRWLVADPGARSRDELLRALLSRGFQESVDERGLLLLQRQRGELMEQVTLVGPSLPHSSCCDADALRRSLIASNELIFFVGYSFGDPTTLFDEIGPRQDPYRIFMMSACQGYSRFGRHVFDRNFTLEDPMGWRPADVINDTGLWGPEHGADGVRILLSNLLQGAQQGGVEDPVDGSTARRAFSWEQILRKLNHSLLDEAGSGAQSSFDPYGASGIANNDFTP